MDQTSSLSAFIKYNREKLNLTQEMLAARTGVGIHFIRDIEQGKESLRMDKVNKVISLFGYRLGPQLEALDPYQLWYSYKDQPVEITTKDKHTITGFLMEEIRDVRNSITAWKLVPFPLVLEWMSKEDDKFAEIIKQEDIDTIKILHHEQIRKSLTSK